MGKKRAFSKLRRNHNLPKKRTMKKGGMDPDFSIMPPPPPAPAPAPTSSSNPVNSTPRYRPQTKLELENSISDYPGNRGEKGDINTWDVTLITDMSKLFMLSNFNEDISGWDVSNVTDMTNMFNDARDFNQPLNTWNVRNVTSMRYMFCEAHSFNQPLDSWDVRNVTNMSSMFEGAISFNQPLNTWNVSNVTNMDNMFWLAENFNQPLNSWDVRNITNMSYMFLDANNFRSSLIDWDIINVRNLENFSENIQFEWPLFRKQNVKSTYTSKCKQLIQQVYQNTHNERYRQLLENFNAPAPLLPSDDFTSQNIFNRTNEFPLEDSANRATPNDEGYDLINLANVKVSDYLNEDPNNVIFYMYGKIILLSDKPNIRNIILNSPSIKYRCIEEGTTLVPVMTNVDTENPYVMLNSLGSTSGGLVSLGAMKTILADPSIRIIEIATPEIATAVSTASLQMLGPNPNAFAASHCQAGQGDKIYALKKMEIETTGGTKRSDKRIDKRSDKRRTKRTKRTKKRHVRTTRKYQRRRLI